ncbi:hypothetical protein WJ048_06310 [Listeria welshimeri]|uniref:Conserved phage-related protein, putative n=1 Tax=Listeria welshimeri serovar 6b (strain ATCC 35897 / DSM 20650 / CCUG 15529 / CIP 8149 / NCTC 11857 / SLCC 5334 / V8) TaxID=386043 RepID=A0AI31_LISW6|nr:hypothetical protein [Listeria welshimeri]ELY0461515.1 hypothetical protein [Listeria innocua]ELY0484902.1 hypothetical protein [Listeria innocua]ELY0493717.1 hypothetical protein [Listeria innocua]MBC1663227.1 hypothetical protein [Listeria welshimeri]MBC2089504.1 hypothetical protein [Listeria welshimeri]
MKGKLLVVISLASISLFTACSNNENVDEKQINEKEIEKVKPKNGVISYHGKYLDLAENMGELEGSSPIIVTVTKNSEKSSVKKESVDSDIPTEFYTLSEVTVNNIEKDETGLLKENQSIKIIEDSVENVSVDGEKYDLTIDGYKNMNKGEEYTLFIRKSKTGDNYVLTNAVLSKYPVEKETELFLEDGENIEESVEVEDTYKEIYQDVLIEYN